MKNKKKIIAIGLSAIAIIACASIVIYFISRNFNKEEIDNNKNVSEGSNLPMLVEIDSSIHPILYDFVYGSLGYKSDIDVTKFDPFFVIAYEDGYEENMFVSFYTWGEEITTPPIGNEVQEYKLIEQNIPVLNDTIDNMSLTHKFTEDDWHFIIVEEAYMPEESGINIYDRLDSAYRFAGINMQQFNDMTKESQCYKDVYNEQLGYPSEWLRKSEYKQILEENGINIENEFFDKWNLYQVKKYYKAGDKENSSPITAKVMNMDMLEVTDGEHVTTMHESELNLLISGRGYEAE